MTNLTNTKILKLKPREKAYRIKDIVDNLYLEIRPSGKMIWRYIYVSPIDRKRRWYTIGSFSVYRVEDARKQAIELTKLIHEGVDPSLHKRQIQEEKKRQYEEYLHVKSLPTFTQVAEEYLNKKSEEVKYSYFMTVFSRYKNYIEPAFGKKKIDEVTERDIVELIKKIPTIKKYIARNTNKSETQKRVFGIINEILQYAKDNFIIENNVARNVNLKSIRAKRKVKHFDAVLELKEFRRLIRAILDYPSLMGRNALLVQAITALRPMNVATMRWEWIDFENKVIQIPKEHMKSGRNAFRISLTPKLEMYLQQMQKYTADCEYVFVSALHPNRHMSKCTLRSAIRNMGFKATAHGFRASFSTLAREYSDFRFEAIEAQLDHRIGNEVTQAYLRTDFFEERRKLLEWWERFIFGE